MAGRNELAIRARALGLDDTTIPNDSKLEQKVLWLEKRSSAVTGTAPTTTLTAAGIPANNDTITLGGLQVSRTYTFKTALTGAPYEVLIGAAATNSLDNLKDAINGTQVSGNQGTTYGTGTQKNMDFAAGTKTASTLVISSTDTNANGSAPTTKSSTNLSFTGSTMSAGTLGSLASATSTATGGFGVSGDANTTQ